MSYFLLILFAVLSIGFLWQEGLLKDSRRALCCACFIFAAMALRAAFLNYATGDYNSFLHPWTEHFRNNGGFAALKESVGNYNLPYLYFLALFSYLNIRDLYLIKLLSILCDVLLAAGVEKLASLYVKNDGARCAAFCITLFLPTVVLNGSLWGQCDSVYTAFAVWSLYYALKKQGVKSMICMAVSFGFKLQAVFLMPVFLILLFAKKIRWRDLIVFPITYFVLVLPAILLGRPAKDTILLYFNQAGSIGSGLNYNSPSVFAFVRTEVNADALSRFGICAAFAFLVLLFVFCYLMRDRLNDRALLIAATLICIGVPFLLPHMHDRYFFLADVLSLAAVFAVTELLPLPFLVSFASLLGYHAYLKMRYLLPMRYGAGALVLAILILIAALAVLTGRKGKHSAKKASS